MNFKRLDDFLDRYLPSLGIPGSDTAILVGGKLVYRHQGGYDDIDAKTPLAPDAMYHLYSCTKVSTCVAATQLIERGVISLNEPVSEYLPEFSHMKVAKRLPDGRIEYEDAKKPILIRHLLTMTSGMNYDLSAEPIRRAVEETGGAAPTRRIMTALAEIPLSFEPGDDYQYSLSLDVIGGVIEVASGMPFGKYLKENIFDPLGMKDTTFEMTPAVLSRMATQYAFDPEAGRAVKIPKDRLPYRFGTAYESGGAGLSSTVDDQILLADALTHLGRGKNGARILTPAAVDMMRTNALNEKQMASFHQQITACRGYGYGFGVRVNVAPAVSGTITPVGEFGWDGAKLCYLSADPTNGVSFFHAEHMGQFHEKVQPRLRNIVYSCLEEV